MILDLRIENFAIIDHLELSFTQGLIVFTGETGAGKSIIIDAVETILGGRTDITMLRAGAEMANIEASFSIPEPLRPQVSAILEKEELLDDPQWITLGRQIRSNGRSAARVNGRSVSAALLKEIGQFKHLREFRMDSVEGLKTGDIIDVSQFKPGDKIDIIGVSKGKGFAGVVKRHHFKGGSKTHGQSDRQRAPGAIGSTTTPGHVWKGLRMAGHLGDYKVTAQNLEVHSADIARNLLLIEGAVPGAKNSLVIIRKSPKGS